MSHKGQIVEIIGAVIDVEFPAGQTPRVYDALTIDEHGITLETQQQIGDLHNPIFYKIFQFKKKDKFFHGC